MVVAYLQNLCVAVEKWKGFDLYVPLDVDFPSVSQQLETHFEFRLPQFTTRPKQSQSQALYAVFSFSSLFCYIEHKRFGVSHSCPFWLHLKFFGSICYPTPFFLHQSLFQGRILFFQFQMFFENMTDKNQDISFKFSKLTLVHLNLVSAV